MPTLYQNRPGGTIAKIKDGTTHHFKYGETVDPSKLDESVDYSSWTDTKQRVSQADIQLEQAREAARSAASTVTDNVNSSASPVPGNYGDLDEDGAAVLVGNLARFPEQQAALVQHEILFGGNRQKVVDAAGEYAILSANSRIAGLLASQKASDVGATAEEPGVASTGDPDQRPGDDAFTQELQERAMAQANGGTPPPTSQSNQEGNVGSQTEAGGFDGDGPNSDSYWTNQQLKDYADQHDVEVGGNDNRSTLLSKLAVAGHTEPQSPKPA